MSKLLLHTGGREISLTDLQKIEVPETTKSYKPVSHYDLVMNLTRVSKDLLNDKSLYKTQLATARKGNQLFGILTYKNGSDDIGLSIGFRNSYDKSMSVGIAVGASVFVCDNLALTGKISIMRKHTVNVWIDLEEMMVNTIYRSQNNFTRILEDAQKMKEIPMNNTHAFETMGLLYGKGVLQPRMLPIVKKNWLKPTYPEFEERNKWSFYNACTEALKKAPPTNILEKHIKLHEYLN